MALFPATQQLPPTVSSLLMRWGFKPFGEGLRFWLAWSSLTWLAFLATLLIIEVGERSDLSPLEGCLGGGLVGLIQAGVLRPYLKRPGRWMLASALGWSVLSLMPVGAIGWMAPATSSLGQRLLLGVVGGGWAGLCLGLSQTWALGSRGKTRWRWSIPSAATWAVAMPVGWGIGGSLRLWSQLFISEVVGLGVAWGAIAGLSGLAMVRLLYGDRFEGDRFEGDRFEGDKLDRKPKNSTITK